jgi:hypothetical protein
MEQLLRITMSDYLPFASKVGYNLFRGWPARPAGRCILSGSSFFNLNLKVNENRREIK